MSNVTRLPPSTTMSVRQALDFVSGEHEDKPYESVLIILEDEDGDLIIRSSELKRNQANWLVDMAKLHVLDVARSGEQ